MEFLLDSLRWTHVVAGFLGLAAFWIPVFARKGGANHRLYGKIFKYSAYVVLVGAIISVILHTIEGFTSGVTPADEPSRFGFLFFLGYLGVVVLIGLRHGIQVLENKRDVTALNTPLNRTMAWLAIACSVALIGYALYYRPSIMVILLALSPIGFGTGSGILKAIRGKRTERKVWYYEHMNAMLGTGIAFHTAFAVFGSRQIFEIGLQGWVAVVPWVLPALIGIPATSIWIRYYKRKFNDMPGKTVAQGSGASA